MNLKETRIKDISLLSGLRGLTHHLYKSAHGYVTNSISHTACEEFEVLFAGLTRPGILSSCHLSLLFPVFLLNIVYV